MAAQQEALVALRLQLGLTDQSDVLEDDVSVALHSLLVGAARDADPTTTVQFIYDAILDKGLVPEMDVFTTIPILILCSRDASDAFLNSIAEQCSAKEMIIALQEAGERLANSLTSTAAEDETDDEDTASIGEASDSQQVVRIVQLYAKVVPRLPKGKKTPSLIVQPPLTQLQGLLQVASLVLDEQDARAVLRALSALVAATASWASPDEEVKDLLYTLALSTLQAYGNKLGTDVASKAFAEQFPRLRQPQKAFTPHATPIDSVAELSINLQSIGLNPTRITTSTRPSSLATLIFLAHSATPPLTLAQLQNLLPLVVASLQANIALPSTLALLLRTLGPLRSSKPPCPPETAPLELLATLSSLLPQIASLHPDPLVRHIAFRILSLVLTLTPSLVRMKVLLDLVSPPERVGKGQAENMAVASVGLVKEAVLAALSFSPSTQGDEEENVFATPMFTEVLVPAIFTPRLPPSTTDEEGFVTELEQFLESSEPSRLVEVLGLYFLLVKRDTENKTGIRGPDTVKKIQNTLLNVVREKLRSWDQIDTEDAKDVKMQLGIIDMWLDRIDEARG